MYYLRDIGESRLSKLRNTSILGRTEEQETWTRQETAF